jgi:hypothetical protein
MSKKLIAVASAAALALSALVGVAPATALLDTTNNLLVTNNDGGNGTSATPYLKAVPQTGAVADADIIEVAISTDLKRKAVSITSFGGVKLLDEPGDSTNKYTSKSGLSALTLTTDASGQALFYVYSTSTTKNRVIVNIAAGTDDAEQATLWFNGVVGAAYNITNVVVPGAVAIGSDLEVSAVVTDVFGNRVETGTIAYSTIGALTASGTLGWDSVAKVHNADIDTTGATSGQIAVSMSIADASATITADGVKLLGKPVFTAFAIVGGSSLEDQVKALTTQVAALQAQLANSRAKATSVTKKKYNTLARKWNRANPSNKVALKK